MRHSNAKTKAKKIARHDGASNRNGKLKRKEYEAELSKLHVEVVKLQ